MGRAALEDGIYSPGGCDADDTELPTLATLRAGGHASSSDGVEAGAYTRHLLSSS